MTYGERPEPASDQKAGGALAAIGRRSDVLPLARYGLTFGFNPKCACSFVKRWWFYLSRLELKDAETVHGVLINLQRDRPELFLDDPSNFHVAFIRNPLERIRSAYADKVGNPYNKHFYMKGLRSFGSWIESLLSDVANQERWDVHWRPQSIGLREYRWDRFVDIDGDLEAAVRSLERRFDLPELTYDHHRLQRIPKSAVSEEILAGLRRIYRVDFDYFAEHCPEIAATWICEPVDEEDYVFSGTVTLPEPSTRRPPWDAGPQRKMTRLE